VVDLPRRLSFVDRTIEMDGLPGDSNPRNQVPSERQPVCQVRNGGEEA
jgi:hypothetical protein